MKRIVKYTFGWDIITKNGYITLTDDQGENHAFRDLTETELQLLSINLHKYPAFIDHKQWIVWETQEYKMN